MTKNISLRNYNSYGYHSLTPTLLISFILLYIINEKNNLQSDVLRKRVATSIIFMYHIHFHQYWPVERHCLPIFKVKTLVNALENATSQLKM
jgi:hypothetical protein